MALLLALGGYVGHVHFDPLTVSADGKLLSLTAPPLTGLCITIR